ncbi:MULTISPECIES: hypothetical protein [Lacticaseibacillus]|uniref:Glycosyltransferase n=2 Tax=Lacticaseibacillus TaxID=2759736 RepID=A0AAN1KF45_LACCA|nr:MULTISPECIES: hypothetical protein [Lacticaseibacillus]ARY92395.1 hypothetical protein BGL52_11745 [Lacticaseibacillus casei]KAB1971440.1 hypothetical protein F9B82_02860 [Lacticaseibacillus casei]WLV80293.1 hypothetical protein LACSTY_002356 [Lacticaseibacillus sp. NCIMB 15473]WNX24252.1 hypothetical protein RWA15_11500 [Lacticaseibacillus casei]WNX27026.1 hypothetical protein RWA16_11505 [Lacticaseibacillus casei]
MVYFLTYRFEGDTPSGKEQVQRLQLFADHQLPASIIVVSAQEDLDEQVQKAHLQSDQVMSLIDALRGVDTSEGKPLYTIGDIMKLNDYQTKTVDHHLQFLNGDHLMYDVTAFDDEAELTAQRIHTITFFGANNRKSYAEVYDRQGNKVKTVYFQANGQVRLAVYFYANGMPLLFCQYDGNGILQHLTVLDLAGQSAEFTDWTSFAKYCLAHVMKQHPGKLLVDQPSRVFPMLGQEMMTDSVPVVRTEDDVSVVKQAEQSNGGRATFGQLIADPHASFASSLTQYAKVVPIAAAVSQQSAVPEVKPWAQRLPGRVAMELDNQNLAIFEQLLSTLAMVRVKENQVKLDLFVKHQDQALVQQLQERIETLGLSSLLDIQTQSLADSGDLARVLAFIVADLGNLGDADLLSSLTYGTPVITFAKTADQMLNGATNGELGIVKPSEQVLDAATDILKLLTDQTWWQEVSDHALAAAKPLQGLTGWELWKMVL